MEAHPHDDHDVLAEHNTRIIAHLDGALSEQTLEAVQGVWAMLEHASASGPSHARAVRSRLFWESLRPGGVAAAPSTNVSQLMPSWDESADVDDEAQPGGETAQAA